MRGEVRGEAKRGKKKRVKGRPIEGEGRGRGRG